MQKLIDLLKDIIAWCKKAWKDTGDWNPSVVKELEPKATPKKRGRPKGSKNKNK